MTGLEKITGRILEDARQKAQEILDTAQAQADGVLADYDARAQALRAQLEAEGEAQAAQRVQLAGAAGEMEGRKLLLTTKQDLVEQTFRLALQKLLELPQAEYQTLLTDLLVQAAPSGKGEVIFNPADREALGQAVVDAANARISGSALTLSAQTRPIRGGFLLDHGAVEVNCTLESLVAQERERSTGDVAKQLFPEG